MFCTTCASFNQRQSDRCLACGTALPVTKRRGPGSARTFRRRAVGMLPMVLLLALCAALIGRAVDQRQELAAAYASAEVALAAGDLEAARLGFSDAGDYRDARERANGLEAQLAPYREAVELATAAIDDQRYDEAVATLLNVVTALPNDGRAIVLLENARAQRLAALELEAEEAERAGDWLAAERALTAILAEDPEHAEAAARLEVIRAGQSPLLFSREGTIYVSTPDLSRQTPIVKGLTASWPVWSPDRSRVAFMNYPPDRRSIDGDLYVVNADGTGLRLLTTQAIPFSWPVWAPDGSSIAFMSSGFFNPQTGEGHIPIFVVDVATGVETDLTGDAFSYAAVPTWSPDSTRIAFVDRKIQATGSSYFEIMPGDVQVVDVRTRAVTNLTETRVQHEWWVSWSPRSERVAVMTNPGDWTTEESNAIYLVDATTGDIDTVPTEVWRTGYPYWSPDGSRIAFVESEDVIRIWSEAGVDWIRFSTDISLHLTWAPDSQSLIAPAATSVEPSYIVPVGEHFGARTPIRIEFDTGNGPNGPPVWAPRSASPAPPDGSGTALDTNR